ncbi:hypothetical protein TNCV_810721 [Trichonephila clavipes]|uniref:Uncharacterized protein n=1 Tax=Trichonephila clavipes TaxID=2585209 RepID=A0A8X6S868_TRICX|nr:hypothetical protein TNCV_810721 [Trichonephila clavipes]
MMIDVDPHCCLQRLARSRASHSCLLPAWMIYGTCRGGDVITGVEESDDGCSCRRRWSSLRNSVAREAALRLAETVSEKTSLLAVQ